MEKEENLDLLDLEDSAGVDTLPEAAPFSTSRPKKPWLLMGLGLAIIVLATWIIVAKIGSNSDADVSVNLDIPVETVENVPGAPVENLNVPVKPVDVAPVTEPVIAPVEKPVAVAPKVEDKPKVENVEKPVVESGVPVRVINDRKDVTFNPAKGDVKKSGTVKKAATKPVTTATNGGFYVQFGSYATRAAAESAEQKMRTSHTSLFSGKQFVILSANVNGQTKYRLRVAFNTAGEADGFCKNAKSDGLECYVTR